MTVLCAFCCAQSVNICVPVGDYAAATAAGKPENFSQNKKVLLTGYDFYANMNSYKT